MVEWLLAMASAFVLAVGIYAERSGNLLVAWACGIFWGGIVVVRDELIERRVRRETA